MTDYERLRDTTVAMVRDLPEQELRIAKMVVERLYMGAEQYGQFDLERDRRNFLKEALEEDLDGMVYRAARLLRLEGL